MPVLTLHALASVDDGTEDSDDATLLDVWDEMDVTFKIIEEHLVPFLTEDISHEPHQYYSYVHTIQEHLNKLGKGQVSV